MRISVHDLYRQRTRVLEGDPESVDGQLTIMFPELAREVDPDDGVLALVDHLNDRLQGYEVEVHADEDLAKMAAPGPKFPKLGVGDDRRETPYVTDKKQLFGKLNLMAASNANHPANAFMSKPYMLGHLKDDARHKFYTMAYGGEGGRGAATSASTGVQTGYVRAGAVAASIPSNSQQHGTKLHEDFHMNMNRVERKHGLAARRNLAQNLYNAIPKQYREIVDHQQKLVGGPDYEQSQIPHEETLARLLNYMNSENDRGIYHARAQDENPAHDSKQADLKLRRAYRAMLAAADMAHEGWLKSGRTIAKSEKDLAKVSLTPESTANRMTPHQPHGSTAYHRVETYDLGNGNYHHVFYDSPMSTGYRSVMHSLSTSPNPLGTGYATSASGIHPAHHVGEFPDNSFVNSPWQDQEPVIVHGETASRGPKGSGTRLYQEMLRVHGRMASDSSTSAGANGVWEKLARDPQFKVGLGYGKGERHWAEYHGPKPVPAKVYEGDGRPLENMLKEPVNPYSAQIQNFKLKNGGDYLEARVHHKDAGEVGHYGLHLDHANKRLYSTGPYWSNRGVPGNYYFQPGHSQAAGVARHEAEKATGYRYAGELPTELAEPMAKAESLDEIDPHTGMSVRQIQEWTQKHSAKDWVKQYPLSPSGYHLAYYDHGHKNEWGVEAYTPEGVKVGEAQFARRHRLPLEHEDQSRLMQDGLKGWNVEVHPEHRRRGLARDMYAHAEKMSGMKIHPGDFQTPEGGAFLANRGQKPVGKSEPLEKMGAMARLAPFNPAKPEHRLESRDESSLADWQAGTSQEFDDGESHHRGSGYMSTPARLRALHKLSAATPSRTVGGKREFLLHRGMSPEEYHQITQPANITHPDVVGGTLPHHLFVNHAEDSSSWTPNLRLAQNFAREYGQMNERGGLDQHLVSAWIPEDAIDMVPMQYGKLDPDADFNVDNEDYRPPVGENNYSPEHEVIVNPGHNSRVATADEVRALRNPRSTLHGRINEGGREDRNYSEFMDPEARVAFLRDRLKHRMLKAEPGNLDQQAKVVAAMLGFEPQSQSALEAARFLSGGEAADVDAIRRALWEHDGDLEATALTAYGLDVSDENRKALRAVQKNQTLKKSEADDKPPSIHDVEAGYPEAKVVADKVKEAVHEGLVEFVKLGGKHAKGSMLAMGNDEIFLLKPGSGKQSPAAGAQEEHASQSRREAAFWHVAKLWHLDQFVPEAELLLIDGKEVAAIHMLAYDWRNASKQQLQDPQRVLGAVRRYADTGILHRWAILDFVTGNPDRHGQNVMIGPENQLKLIDHGSAFAGPGFDPGRDKNSFVPWYLRAQVPQGGWQKLDVDAKLKAMPKISAKVEQELRSWFEALDAEAVESVLTRYGINPQPTLERLHRIKALKGPLDEAVNRLWVTV